MGCSPSGAGCFNMGFHGHKCWQQTCPNMGHASLHNSQVLTENSCRMDFPWGHSIPWTSTCSCGVLLRLQVDLSSPWTSMAAGAQLPQHGLHRGLHGNLSSEHLLPLLLHHPGCLQSHFSHRFSLLSLAVVAQVWFFFSSNTLSQQCYHCCWWPWLWTVWSILEPYAIVSIRYGQSF